MKRDTVVACFGILGVVALVWGMVSAGLRPVAKRDVDTIEERITVTLRLELSQERAKRVYPDLLDPTSQHSRARDALYSRWLAQDDERLTSTDLPFILAQETAIPSL